MTARIGHAPFRLETTRPLTTGAAASGSRSGLLLSWSVDDRTGYGEISPLPGLHRESLDAVAAALPTTARTIEQADVDSLQTLRRLLATTDAADYPSVTFGFEMAWLGLAAGASRQATLSARPATHIQVAGLCSGRPSEIAADLEAGEFAHYRSLKVKVGRAPLSDERALLGDLMANLPDTRIRLDGNRSLSMESVMQLIGAIDPDRFEYLEEPTANPEDGERIAAETGVRIALDETLREDRGAELRHADWVSTWVVKPAAHHGFAGTLELAQRARDHGQNLVVSSCFESSLGLWALAQLAASLPEPRTAAGLGTDRWLATDLAEPRFDSRRGQIELAAAVTTPCDRLEVESS